MKLVAFALFLEQGSLPPVNEPELVYDDTLYAANYESDEKRPGSSSTKYHDLPVMEPAR